MGGYGETLRDLPKALASSSFYAHRNSSLVGEGSGGISQYDALPMTAELIRRLPTKPTTIVDVGCGDGTYLVDLCEMFSETKGLGIEPSRESVQHAQALASERGVADRIEFRPGSAEDMPELGDVGAHPGFLMAFVLQELLEQVGRGTVVRLLKGVAARYPEASWLIIEVDHRPTDAAVMGCDLGLSYYKPILP